MTLKRALLSTLVMGTFGCGDAAAGGETIFLYVINGYTAAAEMSIVGPRGPLVSSAGFGDRIGFGGEVCDSGKKCPPIEYDRSGGGNFTAVLDGSPAPLEFDRTLQAMYPQETATMILSGKPDDDVVEISLLRHIQSISDTCTFSWVNGLSLTNKYTLGEDQFTISPEFRVSAAGAGYRNESEEPVQTECGPLPVGGTEQDLIDRDMVGAIDDDPWFFRADCDVAGLAGFVCLVWNDRESFNNTVFDNNQIVAHRNTDEYFECVTAAITINEQMMMGPGVVEGDTCPPGALIWDDVTLDEGALLDCKTPVLRTVGSVEPGTTEAERYSIFQFRGDSCENEFRARTPRQDVVFGPKDGDKKGEHQDGDFVVSDVKIDPGSEYFWVILGRPVNPIVWQWDSSEYLADLKSYPYFNDADDLIAEY